MGEVSFHLEHDNHCIFLMMVISLGRYVLDTTNMKRLTLVDREHNKDNRSNTIYPRRYSCPFLC